MGLSHRGIRGMAYFRVTNHKTINFNDTFLKNIFTHLAGGVVGACYGAYKGLQFADILNRLFFGLPTNVVLQQAYDAFGVSCNATVPEVNKAYRNYCRKHHPDKGGDNDEFVKGQFYMEIIRADRMGKEQDYTYKNL